MKSLRVLLSLALFVLLPASGSAAVPDPANSTVQSCLTICPYGDIPFRVIVRDFANVPVANSTVAVNFCNCPGVHLCGGGCLVTALTDATGTAMLNIRGGGGCGPASAASIFADGVFLAAEGVKSPDQDGNLVVDAADVGILSAKTSLPYDPTGDLDCDGVVGGGDLAYQQAHLDHNCQGAVPAAAASWGTVKAIYR